MFWTQIPRQAEAISFILGQKITCLEFDAVYSKQLDKYRFYSSVNAWGVLQRDSIYQDKYSSPL